ncbi:tape measure protein [Haemophilus influenzae]
MASLGGLNISLNLETVQFQQALNKSAHQSQKFARQFNVNLIDAQGRAKQFSERTTQYLNNIEQAANSINKTANISLFSSVANWLGGNLSSAVSQMFQYADSYTELRNQMRGVVEDQSQVARSTEDVFDISLRTNQAIGATSEVYKSFSQNAKTLKISQQDVAELTETVSKAVAMSGASSASASNALVQFSQSLLMGKLKAQEFNSLITQTPTIIQTIAKGLGLTTAEFKAMVDRGEITAEKMVEGLKNAKAQVDSDFSNNLKTLSGAFTNLETSMIKFVGETDQAYGVTQKLVEGVDFVSENLETLIKVAGALIGALAIGHISKYSAVLLQTGYNSAKNAIAHTREAQTILAKATAMRTAAQVEMASLSAQLQLAQSEKTRYALREQMKVQAAQIIALTEAEATAKRNLAAATTLASTAARGLQSAMALLGGPVGVVMIAASALMYFSSQAEQARQKALDTAGANERLKETYEGLSAASLSLRITEQQSELENYQKQIQQLQSDIASLEANWFVSGLPIPDSVKKEIGELTDKLEVLKENAKIDFSVLENQLEALARAMLSSGKSIDDVRAKFKQLGIDASETEWILAGIPSTLDDIGDSAEKSAGETLNLDDAMKKLQERSVTLAQKLEVAKLEQQGQAESAYVLAGLYELLGVEGAKYNEVLIGIATGTITAANATDKAIGMSQETLKKILDGKAMLQGMFQNETKIQTIKTELREKAKKGSGEKARKNWLSFYDDLRKKSGSTLNEINLEETRMFQRLEEHNKKGVVSYQEYETAKTAIAERFARQRLELAGKYAPEKLLKANRDDELKSIQELYEKGQINQSEAAKASNRVQFDYAKQMSQSAVDPLAQFRARFDPNQEVENQRTRDLALLEAIQSGNEQKLLSEEEYQRRKKEIQDKYDLERQKKESDYYAQSTQMMSSAFDTMAGVMANAAGQQSAAYKAMFAASKAFAIAESIINIQLALSEAAKLPYPANLVEYARVASQTASIVSNIQSVTMSFATGGYTGDGGKYTPAGIVHKGEYVITKEATARLGRGFLDHLNYGSVRRGFANGGGVGVPRLPTMAYQPKSSGNIAVKVINNGEPMDATVSQQSKNGLLEITVELVRQIAQAEAGTMLQKNMRPGGLLF